MANYTWNPGWNQRPFAQPISPTPPANTFEWIRGGDAAVNAYQVQPGNTVRLMDADNPVLYVKTVDFTGKPYVETYDLVLRTNKPEDTSSGGYGVSSEEIQQMIADTVKREFNKYNKRKQPRKEEDNV